jgi:pyrophosphatase PpaX
MTIQTLLLDLDGTVLDTREFILAAMIHTLEEHNVAGPSREDLRAYVDGSARPEVAWLLSLVGLPIEEIYERISGSDPAPLVESHRSFQELNLALVTAFPGAHETLASLRDAGVRIAAVTSRSKRTSIHSLEIVGLASFFDAVVSAEDTTSLKPDPAPLRHALALLGTDAAGAAMAGDTAHDIVAGQALGMRTVGATYGFGAESVRAANPDALIESITELPAALGFLQAAIVETVTISREN